MKKSTKRILKIAGVGLAVVTVGYFALREKPKKRKEDEGPPGPGPDGLPGEGEPGAPGLPPIFEGKRVDVVPVWDADAQIVATDMMSSAYTKMGRPQGSWVTVVTLANVVATQIWPDWTWPETPQQSEAYRGAGAESAYVVWQHLIAMARELTGFQI